MQILGVGKKPFTFTLLTSGALLVAACGGTTVFSGQNPVTISGDAPPPPPPPVEAPKPPEPPPKVIVKDNKIEITEKIQFEYNKATILPASFGLLDEIASTIKKAPHIKKIAIEGHASSEGSAAHNLKLSDDRAKAVMTYLVEKGGLKTETFTAKGFGSQKPLVDDTDKTTKGKSKEEVEVLHEKNRRVEFNIIEQDVTKKKVEVDSSGKEKVVEEKTHSEKKAEEAPPPEKKEVPKKDDKKKKDEKKDAKETKKELK
jgi:outer membrane protein OmpA-like peptidoglycan-associated protein